MDNPLTGKECMMLIRTLMAVGVDGFVATPDGRPGILAMPDFSPGKSYGFPGFIHSLLAHGAIDRLGILALRIVFGDGLPLSPPGTPLRRLRLERHEPFPDGTVYLEYVPA
jgi:hypothetical protein